MPQIASSISKIDIRSPEGRAYVAELFTLVSTAVGSVYVSMAAALSPMLSKVDMTSSPQGQRFIEMMGTLVATGLGSTLSGLIVKMVPPILMIPGVTVNERASMITTMVKIVSTEMRQQFASLFQAFAGPLEIMSSSSPRGVEQLTSIGNSFARTMYESLVRGFTKVERAIGAALPSGVIMPLSEIMVDSVKELSRQMTDTVKQFKNLSGAPISTGTMLPVIEPFTAGTITTQEPGEFSFEAVPLGTDQGGTISAALGMMEGALQGGDRTERLFQMAFGIGFVSLPSGVSNDRGSAVSRIWPATSRL